MSEDRLPFLSQFCTYISMKMYSCVQSQCSKRIHDKIQPEQLNGFEHALILATVDCRHNRENDGGNVDRDLELSI